MEKFLVLSILIVCLNKYETDALNLPGPMVYVVTPSPRPPHIDEGRSAPFYYHNWMRRMDTPQNATPTTTTPKTKTPDLIFAEFESGNKMKSIRKLLEREKIEPKTSATISRPIYVPDDDNSMAKDVNYGLPEATTEKNDETKPVDMTDYFALYNNQYNNNDMVPAPVYLPSTPSSTTTTSSTTTAAPAPPADVENIWHIIDSQKYDQYDGKWEEEQFTNEDSKDTSDSQPQVKNESIPEAHTEEEIDENFALPGFATNPGHGAENESRAIRTEPNIRFPYINLKPFQMKTQKKPILNSISNGKKGNNMYFNLDNFQEINNPVRGESQDVVPTRQPIDRYNPAQPYIPQPDYGSKSKQSSPISTPMKAVANLVPPPPPRITDSDFPAPTSYESFPPYAPSGPPSNPSPLPPPPPAPKPATSYQPPVDTSDDSDSNGPPSDSDGPPMDLGYRYKPPSPPAQPFVPTLPPLTKPFSGYSYGKPLMDDMDDKPDFQGYQYSKPEPPSPPQDHPPASYGHDTHSYGPDYPELIFDKPHGGMKDMGMAPPPPPNDMKPDMDQGPPSDDHGFPHDFPGDLKFHHDFDDHDHHYHHHPPPTTTTTETPRVNRYSYYYLGKKLYYLPLYFSVYFIVYVGALIIKAVLRHKIVYPNSWRPNDTTASFFSKRSIGSWDLSNENLHEITGKVTHAIAVAGEKYLAQKKKN